MSKKETKPEQTIYYRMGYDSGLNGSNTKNCNFKLFDTPEHTELWEKGKIEGEMLRAVKSYMKVKGFEMLTAGPMKVVGGDFKYKFTFSLDFVGKKL